MLLSLPVRLGAGAAQICHRMSAAPPLLCTGDQTNVPWLASALLALSLAGAVVLLSRCVCSTRCGPQVLPANSDRSVFYFSRGFQ